LRAKHHTAISVWRSNRGMWEVGITDWGLQRVIGPVT